jgi:hypothetical protein
MGQFWRKEDPTLGEKGQVLVGGMWPTQRAWWDSATFIKAFVAGYGSGKTLIGCKRAVSLALHNAPSPHVWVSPSYKVARRTAIPTIRGLLDGKMSIEKALSYHYNKSEFEFTIKYGDRTGTIWVVSGDDPQSLKGPNIGSANIDEPFIQDREVFDQIMARVRDPDADIREIGLTGTPEELNWGYDICEGEEKENFEIEVFHASTLENKALPENYAARLKKALTDKAAAAYLDGQFVSLSDGLVYYAFSDANVVDLPPPGPNYEYGAGMDFNVDPMAATLFWTAGNHIHFFDEVELPNADTEYMCGHLIEKYGKLPDGRSRVRSVYPDATGKSRHTNSPGGKSDYHYIRDAGLDLFARPVNPPRRDRYNAVNGKLSPKEGRPTMTMSPKCKKLIAYVKQYSHRKLNDEHQKKMSHLLDAMGYPVAYLFPVKALTQVARVTGT